MRISDWSSDVCSSDLAPHAMPAMQMSVQPHDTATTQNSMSDGHCATDSADTKSSPHSSGSKPCKPSAACKLCHSFPSPQAVSWQPSWTIQPHLLLLTDTAVSRSEEHTSELQSLMRNSY